MEKKLSGSVKPKIKKVDKSLDELLDKGYFKEKIEALEDIAKTYGLPKFDAE